MNGKCPLLKESIRFHWEGRNPPALLPTKNSNLQEEKEVPHQRIFTHGRYIGRVNLQMSVAFHMPEYLRTKFMFFSFQAEFKFGFY